MAPTSGSALGGSIHRDPPAAAAAAPAQRPGGSRMLRTGIPRSPGTAPSCPGPCQHPGLLEPGSLPMLGVGIAPGARPGGSRGGRRGSAGCSLHTDI